MEHLLVTGGNEYLPFARSAITKLKKLGLPYADQSFDVNGASIKVRIEPGHEYIRIEGGIKILSGVIKVGGLVDLPIPEDSPPDTQPKKTLRSYKSTENAWTYMLGKNPQKPLGVFNDEKFFASKKVTQDAPKQYEDVTASMYSGLMAKAAQLILGQGIHLKYKCAWDTCHGITLDSKDKPWLVEISKDKGVIAMPLPMYPARKVSKIDAESEAYKLFGGVPSGDGFPEDGRKVISLATPNQMGREAQNVVVEKEYYPDGALETIGVYGIVASRATAFLYKLVITITRRDPNNPDDEDTGTAVLTVVEQGDLVSPNLMLAGEGTSRGPSPRITEFILPGGEMIEPAVLYGATEEKVAPIFVCFIDGKFEVVRYSSKYTAEYSVVYIPPIPEPNIHYADVQDMYEGADGEQSRVFSIRGTTPLFKSGHVHTEAIETSYIHKVFRVTTTVNPEGKFFTIKGCRDGYGVAPILAGKQIHVHYFGIFVWQNSAIDPDGSTGDVLGNPAIIVGGLGNPQPEEFAWLDAGYGGDLGQQTHVQYYAAYKNVYRSWHILGISKLVATIYSRWAPPVPLTDTHKCGDYPMNHGVFRFSTLGAPQYAFTIEKYPGGRMVYEDHVLGYKEVTGITYASKEVADPTKVVVGEKYNFVGHTDLTALKPE